MTAVRQFNSAAGSVSTTKGVIVQDPRIYSKEEIELFLHGDRREIDKLLLISANSIAAAFISFRDCEFRPHAKEEQVMKDALGDPVEVIRRRIWLDQQIAKEIDRSALRKKIIDASALWVLPIILLALFTTFQAGLREKLNAWLAKPLPVAAEKQTPAK